MLRLSLQTSPLQIIFSHNRNFTMKITFLGTNGWYSSKTGLTPCVFIDSKDAYYILDAGEGIQNIDQLIVDEEKPIYLFLSHFHLDHIHGLHVFPRFKFKRGVTIVGKIGTKKMCDVILNVPFSMKLKDLRFNVDVVELEEGKHKIPVPMECELLAHPDPSMGYRFFIEGKTITYCTDCGPSDAALRLAKDSDLYISECAHLPNEYNHGWPHMNPAEAATAAKSANAKKLALMHFDAWRYDSFEKRDLAGKIAREIFPNTIATIDDMFIEV